MEIKSIFTVLSPDHYDVHGCVAKFRSMPKENKSNPPFSFFIHSDDQFDRIINSIVKDSKLPDESSLESKAKAKWCLPQGGAFSFQELVNGAQRYFDKENKPSEVSNEELDVIFADAIDWFTNHSRKFEGSLFPLTRTELYLLSKPTHASSACIQDFKDRRPQFSKYFKHACNNWDNWDPIWAWMRHKDAKYRNIFGDAPSNYIRAVYYFGRMFKWYQEQSFDHASSDRELEEEILLGKFTYSYGGDYAGMDFHLSYKMCDWVLTTWAVKIARISDSQEVLEMRKALKAYWEAPLVVGVETWSTMEHYLYSGIYITHIIECMLNGLLNVQVALDCGLHVLDRPSKLEKSMISFSVKENCAWVLVNGDDSLILYHSGDDKTSQLSSRHKDLALCCGQELEYSKVDHSDRVAHFCKRIYALREQKGYKHHNASCVLVSKYSLIKAVNALYHPENLPDLKIFHDAELLVWFCTIMDCAYGMSKWSDVLEQLFRLRESRFIEMMTESITIEDIKRVLGSDYWLREYVRTYDLPSSYTYQWLHARVNR